MLEMRMQVWRLKYEGCQAEDNDGKRPKIMITEAETSGLLYGRTAFHRVLIGKAISIRRKRVLEQRIDD